LARGPKIIKINEIQGDFMKTGEKNPSKENHVIFGQRAKITAFSF